MGSIRIVTDSSITMEPGLAQELGIHIVPLSVMVDGVVYVDTDLKEGQFLELMRGSQHLPKTSQPPVGVFAEVYTELAEEETAILSIHLSHALSGTVEAARQGALLSGKDVTVIDSGGTDQSLKFQVVAAARMAQAGASKEDILAALEEMQAKTELYIGVSTLENLVKGGRISRVTGLLSSLLHIRVIMEMVNHELRPIAKGRGNKTFTKWVEGFITRLQTKKVAELGISYAGSPDLAQDIKAQLQPYVDQEIPVLETGSVIQTHTGEGAWAILVRYE